MVRLLDRAKTHPADPEIYAGLVHACRYCGLLDASLAAHERAQRLDAAQATSVMHTYFVMGRHAEMLSARGVAKGYVYLLALVALGRSEEAAGAVAQIDEKLMGPTGSALIHSVRAMIEGDRVSSVASLVRAAGAMPDPEGLYYVARHFAYLGDAPHAVDALRRAIAGGYLCYPPLGGDPWFDPIRDEKGFQTSLASARVGHESAAKAFRAAAGSELLARR
jgi:hypothetical protein